MDLSFRTLRVLNRLCKKPLSVISYRNTSTTALKEQPYPEYLNRFNEDIKAGGVVPVFRRALLFPSRVALQDEVGIYTYSGLHKAASALSDEISVHLSGDTGMTVAYLCRNDASHVIAQWAIWMSGNVAVPLASLHPADMIKYFLTDSISKLVICTQEHEKLLRPITSELSKPLLITGREKEMTAQFYQPNTTFLEPKSEEILNDVGKTNLWYGNSDAMIIYTSGTTSKPKGVVWTHSMLQTHIAALHSAWQYSANDVVLHTLPLHHIHGQLNSLNASLAAGARLHMLPSFLSYMVWARLLAMGEREDAKVTVFHGVPAMYNRLVADHERMFNDSKTEDYVRATLSSRMRLMCVGSASLPETLYNKWEKISGIRLLERYGMSEVGMALSNPYKPAERRVVAAVGMPLPGISARVAVPSESDPNKLTPLVSVEAAAPDVQISFDRLGLGPKDNLKDVDFEWKLSRIDYHTKSKDNIYEGELLLKGPGVFTRYLNRAAALSLADFTDDGWFKTGDVASFDGERFKILGRTSVDIIKTGGYKVSALHVESVILENQNIADAAVVGIEDNSYGEIVATVVVLKPKAKLTLKELKDEAGKKLAPYQLPKTMLIVEEMPRNHMGKLEKKEIKKLFLKETSKK